MHLTTIKCTSIIIFFFPFFFAITALLLWPRSLCFYLSQSLALNIPHTRQLSFHLHFHLHHLPPTTYPFCRLPPSSFLPLFAQLFIAHATSFATASKQLSFFSAALRLSPLVKNYIYKSQLIFIFILSSASVGPNL